MANALGVTTHFPCILHKIYNSKTNVYELSYPKCIGVLDFCRNFHLMRTLLSDLNVSCCILNSRREHLPLNWGYKNQNNLQSRYWLMCLLRIIRTLLATLKGKEFQLIQSSFLVHLSKLKHHVFFLTKRNSIVSST